MKELSVSPSIKNGISYCAISTYKHQESENIHYKTLTLTGFSRFIKGLGAIFSVATVSLTVLTGITFPQIALACTNCNAIPYTNSSVNPHIERSVTISLHAIGLIESSGNSKAVGDGGKALGKFQLHQSVVDEYNRFHNTSYLHKNALDAHISEQIASWYLHKRIPQLLRHFKQPITLENILTAYNMGIGNVIKGKRATNYITKYRRLTK